VFTVSRHPTYFKDQHSFVQKGEAALSDWEVELTEKARECPIADLAGLAEEAKVGDGAKGEADAERGEGKGSAHVEKMKNLAAKYAPWTIELKILEIGINDKPLTPAEKRLVVRASRFPMQFDKYGEYKVKRGRALSEWEKELVRQARKWPLEGEVLEGFVVEEWGVREREREMEEEGVEEEEEGLDYGDGSGGKEVEDEDEEEEDTQMNEVEESEKAAATSANPDPDPPSKLYSKTTDPTSKPAANTPTHRPIHPLPSKCHRPVPSTSHRPSLPLYISSLKSLIQSNARALFAAKYPSGSYFDTVTSTYPTTSSSSTSTHHRATLLVYPHKVDRGGRGTSDGKFIVLHSTNFHARIEDAFGELKAWTEGEVRNLLREHGVAAKTDSAASSVPTATSSVSGNGEAKKVETPAGMKRQPDASGKLKRKADGEEGGGEKMKRARIDGDDGESVEEGGNEELKDIMGEEDARAYEAVFGREIAVHEE
jgi:hypothetical protein